MHTNVLTLNKKTRNKKAVHTGLRAKGRIGYLKSQIAELQYLIALIQEARTPWWARCFDTSIQDP